MRKLKLLLAAFALFGVSATWAEDITSTYLNADFTSSTGWTLYSGGGSEHSEGFGLIGTLNLNSKPSTTDATHLSTEYCCGFSARWNGRYTYYQQTTKSLPAGYWTVKYDVQDVNSTSTKYNMDNHFYVQVGETKYLDANTEWMNAGASSWTAHSISFTLTEARTVVLSFGYGNKENKGSSDCPAIYVSHLKLEYTPFATSEDYTNLNTAISDTEAAIASKTWGFETGEYAPYKHAAILEALAAAQDINQSEYNPQTTVQSLTTTMNNAVWSANEAQVNAIAGGLNLDSYYTNNGTYDLPNGWSSTGVNTRILGISESTVASNPGLNGVPSKHALMVKYDTSYGSATGYTLPLRANAVYAFSFKYGSWNEAGANVVKYLKFKGPNDGDKSSMSPESVSRNKTASAHTNTDAWADYDGTFLTTDAGNYILYIDKSTNSQNQMVFSSLNLVFDCYQILGVATELPNTTLTAGTWYYFDIDYDGTYNLTAGSSIGNVEYTTLGTDKETTSSTTAFSLVDGKQHLTAGRYYIKSTSAQTFTVSLDSYDYSLGDVATSLTSGTYIQSLTTLTYTYADAATSNPGASFAILNGSAKVALKKGSTPVAEGTLTLVEKVLTATFSAVTLDKNSTYTLTLPAATVGYDGQVSNSEIVLTVNTPYVFNGDYYIKNTAQAKYLTFGSSWGTRTTLDEVGDLHTVTALPNGTYTLQNLNMNDGNNYIKIDGEAGYSNGTSVQAEAFTITSDGDIKLSDGTNYLGSESANKNVVKAASVSANTKWEFITATERDATISGATIAAPIDITYKYIQNPNLADWSKTANNWTSGGTVAGADHGSYNNGTCVDKNMQHYNNDSFDTYIELTGVPNGVYQFSAAGFYRAGTSADADAAHAAGTEELNAYVYANGNQTPIASIMEGVVAEKYNIKGNESEVTGGYVPNDQPSATFYFWNDKMAINTVTVLVTDGNLRFGMKKDTKIATDWSVFDNFRLKYFGNSTESVTITAAGLATYVSDNDLDFSGAVGLTAYKATISGDKANLTEVTTVPAGEGVLLIGAAGDYEIPVTTGVAAWDADDNDFIRGTGAAVGDKDYILSYNAEDGKYGFYWAQGAVVPTNRAYLSGGSGARLSLVFEGEATGISDVRGKTSDVRSELYDLSGRRVAQPAKGLYIKNGKKVFIK